MPTTTPLAADAWTDVGPTPLVLELAAAQPVYFVVQAAAPSDTLTDADLLSDKQALFLRTSGQRVYVRPRGPARPQGQASVKVSTLAEYLAAVPPVDLNKPTEREALLEQMGAGPQTYILLAASKVTGPAVGGVRGGDYTWRIEGTFSSGVTATLQYLGLDGTTWKNVRNNANTADVSATGEAQIGIGVGHGAIMRVLIAGTQTTALNSSLGGLS